MCYYKKQTKQKTNNIIKSYYTSFSNKKLIAYCSSMAPIEILKAFGFQTFFPENHAVILGAKRIEESCIKHSSAKNGFTDLNCTYLLSDIGSCGINSSPLSDYKLPPKPDLLVYNTNQCIEIKHWFQWYAKYYNIPIVGIETPHSISRNDILVLEYVEKQLKHLIKTIENLFNIKFSEDKFTEIITNSAQCSIKWQEILNINKKIPAPLNFIDHCNLMAPAVLMRGDQIAIDFYNEIQTNLQTIKDFEIKEEKHRIIWCGLPIWGALRYLSELCDKLETNIVGSVYASSWAFNFIPERPLQSMAKSYSQLFINLTEAEKLNFLNHLVKAFNADGIIFHHSHSCKRNSDNHYGLSKQLKEVHNIPSITFEADHNSLKYFNKRHYRILIEAFIDQLNKIH